MNIGTLTASLGVDSKGLIRAQQDMEKFQRSVDNKTTQINKSLQSVGRHMKDIGKSMSTYVSLPLVAVGAASFKMAKDFEASMSKVVGLVGVAQEQVDEWSGELTRLAPQLGKAPKELADALFFVTSAGIKGAEAMEVLEMSAKASTAGLGETKVVANLVTSAMNAYGSENLSAKSATDILTASVREGKAEASALAASMGQVLPIASEMGITFDQVGAATAAMTRTGTDASTAATQLRQIMASLLKPTQQSEDALKAMGTSSQALRKSMREEGLIQTLDQLRQLTNQYGEETMSNVFPNIRALSGVLDLMGQNAADNVAIFDSLTNATGATDKAFEAASETMEFKWKSALGEGQALLIEIGNTLKETVLPMLEWAIKVLRSVADWFRNLSDSQKQFISILGGVLVALGPVLYKLGFMATHVLPGLIKMGSGAIKMLSALRLAMLKNPATALAIAIMAVVAALAAFTRSQNIATEAQERANEAGEAARELLKTRTQLENRMVTINQMNKRQLESLREEISRYIQAEEDAVVATRASSSQRVDSWEQELDALNSQLRDLRQITPQSPYDMSNIQNQISGTITEIERLQEKIAFTERGDVSIDTGSGSVVERMKTYLSEIDKLMKQFAKNERQIIQDATSDINKALKDRLQYITRMNDVLGDSYDDLGQRQQAFNTALQEVMKIKGITPDHPFVQNLLNALDMVDRKARDLQIKEILTELSEELRNSANMYAHFGDGMETINSMVNAQKKAIEDIIALYGDGIIPDNVLTELERLQSGLNKLTEIQNEIANNAQIEDVFTALEDQLKVVNYQVETQGSVFNEAQAQLSAYTQAWIALRQLGLEPTDEEMLKIMATMKNLQKEIAEGAVESANIWDKAATSIGNSMAEAAQQLGEGFAGAEVSFKTMVSTIIKGLRDVILAEFATAIAMLIRGEVGDKGLAGLATAAVGVAALSAMWDSYVPEFADGGLLYGEQIIKAGEYAGASSNPEVIAPLDTLLGIMAQVFSSERAQASSDTGSFQTKLKTSDTGISSSSLMPEKIAFELEDADNKLYGIWERENHRRVRYGG